MQRLNELHKLGTDTNLFKQRTVLLNITKDTSGLFGVDAELNSLFHRIRFHSMHEPHRDLPDGKIKRFTQVYKQNRTIQLSSFAYR